MALKTKKGIAINGSKESIQSKELYDRIRKRLKLRKRDISDADIYKVICLANKEIANWIIENPEGYMFKDGGVLAVSKYMPKALRAEREEKIEYIKSLPVPRAQRERLIRRYGLSIEETMEISDFEKLKAQYPKLKPHTFFYTYRVMWFNHRNTDFRKSKAYRFYAQREFYEKMLDKVVDENKDYYEYSFHNFYRRKVKIKY